MIEIVLSPLHLLKRKITSTAVNIDKKDLKEIDKSQPFKQLMQITLKNKMISLKSSCCI